MRPQLVKGTGGRLSVEFSPGLSALPTVTIKRSGGSDLESAAVVGANLTPSYASATLEGAALDAEVTEIPVTFGAGDMLEAGAAVELRNPSYRTEFNIVHSVRIDPSDESAGYVKLRHPTRYPLEAGATVEGLRYYVDLNGAQCPIIATDFRAVFQAPKRNGSTEVKEVIFDVGLRPSDNPASVRDLLEVWPDLRYSETAEWSALHAEPALAKAWDTVFIRIQAAGLNPNRIRDVEPLKPLVVNRAIRALALVGSVPPAWIDALPAFLEVLDKDYVLALDQTLQGLTWYDNEDTGVTSGKDQSVTGRIYLSR